MNEKRTDFKRSLAGLVYILKKSVIGMVIAGLILGGTVGIISKKLIAPEYSAKSAMYIASASDSVLKLADLEVGSSMTGDYTYLITSRPFITEMKSRLGLGSEYTYAQLKSMISVTNPSGTHVIEITAVCNDAKMAADMANALAEVSVAKIADIMESSNPKITEYSNAVGYQVGPNSTRNAIISFILGMILCFAVSYLRNISDDTVKSIDDIDSILELNVLGMVNTAPNPKTQSKNSHRKKKTKSSVSASSDQGKKS